MPIRQQLRAAALGARRHLTKVEEHQTQAVVPGDKPRRARPAGCLSTESAAGVFAAF